MVVLIIEFEPAFQFALADCTADPQLPRFAPPVRSSTSSRRATGLSLDSDIETHAVRLNKAIRRGNGPPRGARKLPLGKGTGGSGVMQLGGQNACARWLEATRGLLEVSVMGSHDLPGTDEDA